MACRSRVRHLVFQGGAKVAQTAFFSPLKKSACGYGQIVAPPVSPLGGAVGA